MNALSIRIFDRPGVDAWLRVAIARVVAWATWTMSLVGFTFLLVAPALRSYWQPFPHSVRFYVQTCYECLFHDSAEWSQVGAAALLMSGTLLLPWLVHRVLLKRTGAPYSYARSSTPVGDAYRSAPFLKVRLDADATWRVAAAYLVRLALCVAATSFGLLLFGPSYSRAFGLSDDIRVHVATGIFLLLPLLLHMPTRRLMLGARKSEAPRR